MCNLLYSFLEKNRVIFSLPFRFRKKRCSSQALIQLIKQITNQLDNSDYSCEIFTGFQRGFIQLVKNSNYYGIMV